MFILFVTTKGERIIVNKEKVLFISEKSKGATVVLDDGTPLSVSQDFEMICKRLERSEYAVERNNCPV